jgi:hypothetical protein
MRTTLCAALLAACAGAALLPVTQASAVCLPVVSWALRDCTEVCDLAGPPACPR